MLRRGLVYGAGLIGLYLVVRYSGGAGHLAGSVAGGTSQVIRTFQGR